MLNAGVVALAIKRRYGVPFIVMEQNTAFALGRLRWWERDLVRRGIAGARQLIAVSPGLAELLQGQYPGSSWDYLPNPLGAAFVADNPVPERRDGHGRVRDGHGSRRDRDGAGHPVTAPSDAEPTSFAYFASAPVR